MPHRLPFLAILLGAAGLLPFLISGLGAVSAEPQAARAACDMLIVYGAIVLSFLGAVHWGFTLATDHDPAERPRLLLGVAPSIGAWLAAGVGLWLGNRVLGLLVMAALFVGTAVVEWRAHERGWVPGGYIALRLALTAIVVIILITVLGVRAIGGHVLL